jgi:hypothetical protein
VKLRTSTCLLVLAVALNLSVLGIRVHSLLVRSNLTITTGTEGTVIYGVWKTRHHQSLYEGINNTIFSNTLYNFMYYKVAAGVAESLNIDGEGLLLSSRLITLAFAILGALVGFATVARLHLFRNRTHILWAASAIALFWFGTSPVGWWSLTARADLGAACFASLGLLCFLGFLEEESIWILLLASVSFFLAWSFKQSVSFTFLGTIIVSIACRRSWRVLLALVGPFAAGVLAALYIGGANYRFNIITLPSLGTLNLRNAALAIVKAPAENPFLLLTPIFALVVLLLKRPKNGEPEKQSASLNFKVAVLGAIYLCTFAGGAFLCLRAGSDINYFFEAGMLASIAVLPSAILLFNWNKLVCGWFFSLASAVVCCVCLLQIAVFLAPRVQGRIPERWAFLRASTFGRLRLLTRQQEEDRGVLAGLIAAAPKPILIIDDIFAQPWHSTNGAYPAFVIDRVVLAELEMRGVVKDDRIATLIKLQHFRTVVVSEPGYVSVARQNGYDLVTAAPDEFQIFSLHAAKSHPPDANF